MPLLPHRGIDAAYPVYRFLPDGTMQSGIKIVTSVELDAIAKGYDKAAADDLLGHIKAYLDSLSDGAKPDFIDLDRS